MESGLLLIALIAALPAFLFIGGGGDVDDDEAEHADAVSEDAEDATMSEPAEDPPRDFVATPGEGGLYFPDFRPGVDRVSIRLGTDAADAALSVDGAGRPVLSVTEGHHGLSMTFAGLAAVPESDIWFESVGPGDTISRVSLGEVLAALVPTDPDAPDDLGPWLAQTGLPSVEGDAPDTLLDVPSAGPTATPTDPDAPDILQVPSDPSAVDGPADGPQSALAPEALSPVAADNVSTDPPAAVDPLGAAEDVSSDLVPEAVPPIPVEDPPVDPPPAGNEAVEESPEEEDEDLADLGQSEAVAETSGDAPSVVRVTTDLSGDRDPIRIVGVSLIRGFDVGEDILYIQLGGEWTDGEPPVELSETRRGNVLVRFDGRLIAILWDAAGMEPDDVVVTR